MPMVGVTLIFGGSLRSASYWAETITRRLCFECRFSFFSPRAEPKLFIRARDMANGYVNNPWTHEQVELLIQLVKEGCSGGLIASRLGMSRNSVIGKVHRLGMKLGNSRNSMRLQLAAQLRLKANYQNRKKKANPQKPASGPKLERSPIPPPAIGDVARKSFAELEAGDCRFPIGEPGKKGFGFCALERAPGSPYCCAHHARAYRPVPVRGRPEPVKTRETSEVMA